MKSYLKWVNKNYPDDYILYKNGTYWYCPSGGTKIRRSYDGFIWETWKPCWTNYYEQIREKFRNS